MTAFRFRMGAGVPGDITRKQNAVVEANQIDSALPPDVFGNPVKLVSGKIRPVPSGATAADIYGFYVRPFPTNSSEDGLGEATPPTEGIGDVLKSGYINVLVNGATDPARGGTVYVRVGSASAGKPIGGIEAAADSSNTIVVTNAYFTGPRDADNVGEIAFNL